MKNSKKVLVALSGGVDSSVAALLLNKQGFKVSGAFMKNWSFPPDSPFAKYCPWKADKRMATRVAAKLDIPFTSFDFQKEYKKSVIDYFFREYKEGRTPNPDVMCNKTIKFDLFLKKARDLGFDYIATGHYVRKCQKNNQNFLYRGRDQNKDQSYFLWSLNQKQIKDSLFPVGEYKKEDVRKIAKKAGLPSAARPDSQGICFVGEIDVLKFLKTKIKPHKGEVIFKDKVVGHHGGACFFTIGQRKGLTDPLMQKKLNSYFKKDIPPMYVVDIDTKTNKIWIDQDSKLNKSEMSVSKLSWIADPPKSKETLQIQIRYQQKAFNGKIIAFDKDKIKVQFNKPQRAVTPGQSAVFYKNAKMLGGGVIDG